MNVIDAIWEAVGDVLYIPKEQFVLSLDGYAIVPEFQNNEMIAAVIHRGPSFHFILFGKKWKLTKELLSRWPGSLIAQYGYAETFTPIEDTRQQRFNKRIGFVETKRDSENVHFRIERLAC